MDLTNKKVSEYYKNLADLYITRLACEDCEYKGIKTLCYKNKDYCASRLHLFMKRILDRR